MARNKLVNGVVVPLTPAEEAARDAEELAVLEAAAARKRREAEQYRERVMFSACDTSLNANWAVRTSQAQRLMMATMAGLLEKRARAGQTPVYPFRGIDLEALNKTTGAAITQNVAEANYNAVVNDIALFDEAWQDAFGEILARINALGTDYAAIEAIDVVNYPGTQGSAWPAFYENGI